MDASKKHILLSFLGKTSQIFTETIYALMIQKIIPINEIKIITTDECNELVSENLLNSKTGKLYEFCQDWNIDNRKIEFSPEHILIAPEIPTDLNNHAEIQTPFINLILQNKLPLILTRYCAVLWLVVV